jgi:hypothetical protein
VRASTHHICHRALTTFIHRARTTFIPGHAPHSSPGMHHILPRVCIIFITGHAPLLSPGTHHSHHRGGITIITGDAALRYSIEALQGPHYVFPEPFHLFGGGREGGIGCLPTNLECAFSRGVPYLLSRYKHPNHPAVQSLPDVLHGTKLEPNNGSVRKLCLVRPCQTVLVGYPPSGGGWGMS